MTSESRQVRRARERSIIRKTMTKAERRQWKRMPTSLYREVYFATLEMVAQGRLQPRA